MNKLRNAISKFDADIKKEDVDIRGELGTFVRGKKVIKVPNRPSYVYVRLRTNQSEVIQAFNDKVSLEYGLPVVLSWSHSKYIVTRRDVDRYKTWEEGSNFVPIHAKTHSFDVDSGNVGRDPVWVYPSQMMPSLVSPFGVQGAENVFIFPYSYIKNNEWKYVGNTGTASIIDYKVDNGVSLVLVTLDTETGNSALFNHSGYIPTNISGSAGFAQYIPTVDTSRYLPLSFVTMSSGTNTIGWQNLHDVRPFFNGGGGVAVNGVQVASNIEFPGSTVYFSGSNAYVEFQSAGGGGGQSDSTLFYVEGRLATGTNLSNMYMITQPTTIDQIGLYVDYLGVSGTTVVDVNLIRSGTTSSIFTTQANRPTLQYNNSTGWVLVTPDVHDFGVGDVLSLDIDSVSILSNSLVVSKLITGTSSGGSGLSVTDGVINVSSVDTITVGNRLILANLGGGNVSISGEDFDNTFINIPIFFTNTDINWNSISAASASQYYAVSSGAQDDEKTWSLEIPNGTYSLHLLHLTGNNRGIYTFKIDGSTVGTVDGYATQDVVPSTTTGIAVSGVVGAYHTLTMKMSSKNGSSGGYYGTVFSLILERTGA